MKNNYFSITLSLLLIFALTSTAQTVWHVDTANSVSPTGLSWTSPLNDLKDALDSASVGDTIWVSKGIYYPDEGTGRRDSTFVLKDSVVILGGFSVADNDTTLATRDYATHVTVLSGEIQDDADSTNNTYILITNSNTGIDDASVLDGFTITAAHNTNTIGVLTRGAGMFNDQVNPTIRNCIFSFNTIVASDGIAAGGGICNINSAPAISNCTFSYNKVYSSNALFGDGEARGGAFYNNGSFSTSIVTQSTFDHNETEANNRSQGGAVYNESASKPEFENCIFSNNACGVATGSNSWANGAAIFNTTSANVKATNCLFYRNSTVATHVNGFANGGAICNFQGPTLSIDNCTFANNTATNAVNTTNGGAIWSHNTTLTIDNSILFGNTATTGGQNFYHFSGTTTISYSDIGGCGGSGSWGSNCGTDGGDNIDSDPFYVDDANDNYELDTCSPAFNTGNVASIPSGITTDLNGESRIKADSVDMGAFEKNPSGTCVYTWDGSTDTDWGTAANWDRNAVPPDFASINIPDVSTDPTLDTTRVIGSLTIETGGDLTMGKNKLQLYGNLSNSGTLTNDTSTLEFLSDQAQTISGNVTIDTLIANGSGGVTISSGTTSIMIELRLEQGAFNTGGSLTLLSDSNNTARIAEIVSGASISGNVTVQQFVAGANQQWRLFSSPVQGRTIADWDDDMITTGFTGSDFPTFGWTNVYSYDETLTGASTNGFVAPTNVTDAIGVGEGFMLYLGGSGDTIFDVTGAVNTGTVNLNLDFTSTPSAADDGWNLIGNPLPSAVDFGSLTTANIDNKYYITDPATGNSAVWDEDLTLGTLGADGDIGQSQGFWVQTTALSASIAFPESAKTADANLFFSKKTHPPLYISLYVSNKLYDETIVRSDENASNDFGLNDTRKLWSGDTTLPALSTVSSDAQELAINTLGGLEENTIVPIVLKGTAGNVCKLEFKGTLILSYYNCVVLEDTRNNQMYDLTNDTSYSFTLPATGTNEFLQIRITTDPTIALKVNDKPRELKDENFICDGDEITLTATGADSSTFTWNNNVNNGEKITPGIGSKTYNVIENNSFTGCETSNDIVISVKELPAPTIVKSSNMLETELFEKYQWYLNDTKITGATGQTHEIAAAGIYTVEAWNEFDCSGISSAFDFASGINDNDDVITGISLFPNPGQDVINLRMNVNKMTTITIAITDILGKTIVNENITNSTGQVNRQYELSEYTSGIYFVTIQSDDGTSTIKWVKN